MRYILYSSSNSYQLTPQLGLIRNVQHSVSKPCRTLSSADVSATFFLHCAIYFATTSLIGPTVYNSSSKESEIPITQYESYHTYPV